MREPGDAVDEGTDRHARTIACLVAVLVVWALRHAAAGVVPAEETREDWAGDDACGAICGNIAIKSGDLRGVGRVDKSVTDRYAGSRDIVCKTEPGAVIWT